MTNDSRTKALDAARAAQNTKGQNLTIIDLTKADAYTDYLVIVTAWSERQTRAISDSVVRTLREEKQKKPISVEGFGSWILIDYGDVVVHIFHEDTRAYYDLDKMWSRSPRIPIPPPDGAVNAMAG